MEDFHLLKRILVVITLALTTISGIPTIAHAATYSVTYNANASQINTGITSGSLPSQVTGLAAGTLVTVADQGSLARQGFTITGYIAVNSLLVNPIVMPR